jgi:hypothetical protein
MSAADRVEVLHSAATLALIALPRLARPASSGTGRTVGSGIAGMKFSIARDPPIKNRVSPSPVAAPYDPNEGRHACVNTNGRMIAQGLRDLSVLREGCWRRKKLCAQQVSLNCVFKTGTGAWVGLPMLFRPGPQTEICFLFFNAALLGGGSAAIA